MTVFLIVSVFAFGLIVGSFLDVFIARYQTGLKLTGRSFCFSCGHELSWRDLVPVFSFIFQKSRCRYCGVRIPWRYPFIELVTGIVFILVVIKTGISLLPHDIFLTVYYLFAFSTLIAIVFYDIRHNIIPNALVYFFIALSLLGVFIIHNPVFIIHNVLAGLLLAFPFVALWFFSKGKWIGFGDAKLALGMGWFLGPSSGAAAAILAVWVGAATGIILLALQKYATFIPHLSRSLKRFTIKSEIPFAPFLIIGTALAFLYNISFSDIQSLFMN